MTISYVLTPIPIWTIIGNNGLPAPGAKLYTRRSLNKIQDKTVYQDSSGTIPWSNPIIFDANGTKGPFYWEIDSSNLNDTYYLEAYDSDDNLLWTLDNYSPPGSGGGGGNSTSYLPLRNMIANSVFIDHSDDTANPTNTTNLVVAPSNHIGFTPDIINPVIGTYGAVGPNIRFVKNNTAATDQISFGTFPLGTDPFTGDVTPVQYLRYQCTNSPVGETLKAFQFPITQKIHNLENQNVTWTLWAKVAVTPVTLTLNVRQYFGSGGTPSAEVLTPVGTMDLTTSWQKFNIQFTIPVTAGTLGDCGDDAVYLQLSMPLGTPCDVWFTKPSLYLGTIGAFADFDTYDEINSITQTPRTGDIKLGIIKNTLSPGWISMNDGSIGNATSLATTRANQDTFFLFKTIWDCVSDTYAPVSGGRGASAVEDFSNNKRLTLTRTLGRALSCFGDGAGLTSRALGEYTGTETHTIIANELPVHTHSALGGGQFINTGGGGSNYGAGGVTTSSNSTTGNNTTANNPFSIMQPAVFYNVMIKL